MDDVVLGKPLTSHVRWMIRMDMPDVLRIFNDSFDERFTEDDLYSILQHKNAIAYVSEVEGSVVGFMIYFMYKGHIDIGFIAVDKCRRRSGLFSQMIDKAKSLTKKASRSYLVTRVEDTNLSAQLAFKETGFLATSIDHVDGRVFYRMEWHAGG